MAELVEKAEVVEIAENAEITENDNNRYKIIRKKQLFLENVLKKETESVKINNK